MFEFRNALTAISSIAAALPLRSVVFLLSLCFQSFAAFPLCFSCKALSFESHLIRLLQTLLCSFSTTDHFVLPYYVHTAQALSLAHKRSYRSATNVGTREKVKPNQAQFPHPMLLWLGSCLAGACGSPQLQSNTREHVFSFASCKPPCLVWFGG